MPTEAIYISNVQAFRPATAADILPISSPVFSQPFATVNDDYILRQQFSCFSDYYQPLGLNTPHPDYKDYILTNESERTQREANVVEWTRTYAKVPARYSMPSSLVYNFIGFKNTATVGGAGRDRFNRAVGARIQFDYFLIDGVVIKSALQIPSIDEYRYYLNNAGQQFNIFTDNLFSAQVSDPGNVTVPSIEDYMKLVTAKTEIVGQASTMRTWQGNIVERQTVYILPL
jgi:hypothetical protein